MVLKLGAGQMPFPNNNSKDTAMMHSIKGVGQCNDKSNNKYKEDNKLFKCHVSSQRHNSNTVTREDIARTYQKTIRCHPPQHLLAEHPSLIVCLVRRGEKDDYESLQQENLNLSR